MAAGKGGGATPLCQSATMVAAHCSLVLVTALGLSEVEADAVFLATDSRCARAHPNKPQADMKRPWPTIGTGKRIAHEKIN